jgi:hypothetical protein
MSLVGLPWCLSRAARWSISFTETNGVSISQNTGRILVPLPIAVDTSTMAL